VGGHLVRRRQVRDLWPLELMRARAGQAAPGVDLVRPSTVAEVSDLARSGRRLVPMGGASGVCGALSPRGHDLVLDLGGLDRVEIDEANLLVTAGAGVNGLDLERRLNERGLTLGHFPSSLPVAAVGGLVSTRSSGQESTRHGGIEHLVVGLAVVLADGTVVRARRHAETAAGPPLHQLFVGAEGALGVVVEVVLRIRRLPETVIGRGWRLPAVVPGLDVLREAMQRDLRPLVLRLYDPSDSAFQGLDAGCLLVGATAGPRPVAEAEASVLAEVAAAGGAEPLGEEPWQRWLAHRFDLSADRLRDFLEPAGSYLDTIDLAAGWTALPGLYEEVAAHLAGVAGLAMCHFAHASAQGCCAYFTFAGSGAGEAEAEAAYLAAWRGTMEAALRRGATISHHHGVGQVRAPWIQAEMGGWWTVWDRVRRALDPDGRLGATGMGGG